MAWLNSPHFGVVAVLIDVLKAVYMIIFLVQLLQYNEKCHFIWSCKQQKMVVLYKKMMRIETRLIFHKQKHMVNIWQEILRSTTISKKKKKKKNFTLINFSRSDRIMGDTKWTCAMTDKIYHTCLNLVCNLLKIIMHNMHRTNAAYSSSISIFAIQN